MDKPPFIASRAGAVIALLSSLLLPAALPAATVEGLFETQVPVQGRDTAERTQAIAEALDKVLVKASGYRDIPGRPELAGERAQAPRYVQQFRYLAGGQSGGQSGERLRVQFDAAAVTRLLREHGLPVWGQVRPVVLVWLALEDSDGRRWYAPDTDPAGWEALQRAADDRGLPLLLPLLDLDDQSRLTPGELWTADGQAIRAASERYGPDAILVGTLADIGGAWRASWTLLQDTGVRWEGRPGGLEDSLGAGVNWATDALAARYVPLGLDSGGRLVDLRVSGVRRLADYSLVEAHLGSLSMVDQFRLSAVAPDVATFQLRVSGGAAALQRGIALGGLLEPDPRLEEESGATSGAPAAQGGGKANAAELAADAGGPERASDPSGPAGAAVLSYRVRQ